MDVEQLRLRAGRFAALSDVSRIRIVELLRESDHSPAELSAQLGIGANLLSHHLRVLEQAELITRSRSEGDGRRSYLKANPSGLRLWSEVPPRPASRVVFVCSGNSARSPLAAAMWESKSPIPVTSAGTQPGRALSALAVAAGKRAGIDLSPHTPRSVSGVLTSTDLVVTLCDRAHEALRLPDALHWSIPNPGLLGTAVAYDQLVKNLVPRIDELSRQVTQVS